MEIIVVDNNSTDGTKAVIERYPAVTYVFEPEKGITRARQRGLLASSGEILAYVDADTHPPAGWIDQIQEQFKKRGDLACLSGPYSFYDLSGIRRTVSTRWFILARALGWFTGYLMVGGNFAIRRDVLEKMGGFDSSIEFYGEDVDVGKRAKQHGKVLFSPRFVMPTSARRMKKEGLCEDSGPPLRQLFLDRFPRQAGNSPAMRIYDESSSNSRQSASALSPTISSNKYSAILRSGS